eukprot:Rmarinus@m.14048
MTSMGLLRSLLFIVGELSLKNKLFDRRSIVSQIVTSEIISPYGIEVLIFFVSKGSGYVGMQETEVALCAPDFLETSLYYGCQTAVVCWSLLISFLIFFAVVRGMNISFDIQRYSCDFVSF